MNYFLKANKNLLIYSTIFFITIPIFGINFFMSLLGNILLLLFLIPILLLLLLFIGFDSFKTRVKTCNNCGAISLGLSESCTNCGSNLADFNSNKIDEKPSESTIEIMAEEVK